MTDMTPESRRLRRLETLIDVVYGITIWRLFVLLPRPEENPEWESLQQMLADSWLNFVVVAIALIIVIIYWLQNHNLFRYLVKTDNRHIIFCLLQLFFLLMFLYAIVVGVQLRADAISRVFESSMACLLGVASFLGWHYALNKGGLVSDQLPADEAAAITERIKAEPLTALLTIPFAFGAWMWEASWFLYPVVVMFYQRHIKPGSR